MVLDSSAVIAIMLGEPAAQRLATALSSAPARYISAATVVEVAMVLLGRYGDAGESQLDTFLREVAVAVVPVTEDQTTLARDGAARFGRGRHAAALNYGDCFSYALAIALNEPLLFVGEDFGKTDVNVAPW